MYGPVRKIPAATLLLVTTCAAPVQAMQITINSSIVEFSGTGSGSVPLVRDIDNVLDAEPDGWGFAEATAVIAESPNRNSLVSATIEVDIVNSVVTFQSTATLFLDLTLTEVDADPARVFHTGSPLLLEASTPLEITTSGSVDVLSLLSVVSTLPAGASDAEVLAALIDAVDAGGITSDVTDAKYLLGTDINGSGGDDVLTLSTAALDPTLLDFDVANGALDPLLIALLGGGVTAPLVVAADVSVTGLDLAFSGAVQDAALDPPFFLDFTGVNLTGRAAAPGVPEPPSLLLLAAALAGAVGLSRRWPAAAALRR